MVVPTVAAAPIMPIINTFVTKSGVVYILLQMRMVAHTAAAGLIVACASWALCASNQQLDFDLLRLTSLFTMSAVPAGQLITHLCTVNVKQALTMCKSWCMPC